MSRVRGILCLILLVVCVGIGVKCHQNEKALDSNELHYDADDLFILADEKTGLIGVYDGVKPIHYFYSKELFESDLDAIPYLVINRKEDNHEQGR